MIVLSKIYTRTGDAGTTALGDGSRVPKTSARVEAYGTVDEANCTIGLARLHADGLLDARLAMIQNDMFDLGADLCRPGIAAERSALDLWNALKKHFERLKYTVGLQAEAEWICLRFQDFKKIGRAHV